MYEENSFVPQELYKNCKKKTIKQQHKNLTWLGIFVISPPKIGSTWILAGSQDLSFQGTIFYRRDSTRILINNQEK